MGSCNYSSELSIENLEELNNNPWITKVSEVIAELFRTKLQRNIGYADNLYNSFQKLDDDSKKVIKAMYILIWNLQTNFPSSLPPDFKSKLNSWPNNDGEIQEFLFNIKNEFNISDRHNEFSRYTSKYNDKAFNDWLRNESEFSKESNVYKCFRLYYDFFMKSDLDFLWPKVKCWRYLKSTYNPNLIWIKID